MRYVLLFIVSLSCFSASVFANVKTEIAVLEDTYEIAATDMYTMIYVRELSETLQDYCSIEDITTAQQYTAEIKAILEARYDLWSYARVLEHSRDMYEQLADIHIRLLDRLSEEKYCILKYIVYNIQQYLRDAHLDILRETGIIQDFDGYESTDLYGRDVKRAFMDDMIDELKGYKSLLGVFLNFSIKNPSFIDTLTAHEQQLLSRSQELMELAFYKALYDLQQEDLFDANDIEALKDVIILEYVEQCGVVNGKYEIKQTLTSAGEHISFSTNALHLRVNICPNFFVLRELPTMYEKIIIHELGHHYYYYHDYPGHSAFEDICWDTMDRQNDSCNTDDFITPYAQTLSVEDYAEHFMHWFLGILPPNQSSKMQLKTQHFVYK